MKITEESAHELIAKYKDYLKDESQSKLDTTSFQISAAELNEVLADIIKADKSKDVCTGVKLYLGIAEYDQDSPKDAYTGLQLIYGRVSTDDKTGLKNAFLSSTKPCPKYCI